MQPRKKHDACLELLLKSGACINTQDNNGCTALMYAAELSSTDCFNLLLNAGADVNIRNKDGADALQFALQSHDDVCTISCIDAGAEVNREVLMWASKKGYSKYMNKCIWEVLMLVDSDAAARVSGAAETVDYFG